MRLRGIIVVACAASALVLPQAGAAGEGSLYRGPGPRPGPDILYEPLATSPQLENTGIWQAPPILVSGATAYRSGEFVYQDFLYDDHGARGDADPNDPRSGGLGGDSFSKPNGTYTYPTAEAYANNAADLVELRVKPLADATALRLTFNTMLDPSLVATTIAIGDSAAPQAFPHGANSTAPAQFFLTVRGDIAELVDAATKAPVAPAPGATVDLGRRQIEVRVPKAAWDPGTGSVRFSAGSGLWDKAESTYLIPAGSADADSPGGGGGLAAPSAFFNAAFRISEPVPDLSGALANPAWWRDRAQGGALRTGDLSGFSATVDFGKLAAGTGDESGVPQAGALNRILVSHFETKQGRDYSQNCLEQTLPEACQGWLRGRLQPYAIYVPNKPKPASGYGLTLLLHSLAANHNQFSGSRNQSQFGERGPGSIVITPAGRGPEGWYYDDAGADTFEVWADVAARYDLDPAYTSIAGYSMGGYGTYKLATQFPDLFARAQPTVGPPGLGVWAAPGTAEPVPGGRSGNTYYQLESLRHVPFLMWVGSTDELVPIQGTQFHARRFDELGYRYLFDVFAPADHFALAINDQYQPAADFLGEAKVLRDPAHVTYVVNPKMDFTSVRTVADHAYWLSNLRLRDADGEAPRGQVDAISDAFGQRDPSPGSTETGGGTLTGGSAPAISYTRQSKSWGSVPSAPRRDRLTIEARNLRSITVHPERAKLTCRTELEVASDGPLTVQLAGCGRTVRVRPSCLAARLKVGSRGIGRARLGQRRTRLVRRVGTATRRGRDSLRWCVRRGGNVVAVFSRRGDARLIVSTAKGHRARGIRRGTSLRRFRRVYRGARRAGRGLYLTSRSSRIVIGVRRDKVRFVAVADRRLVNNRRSLRAHLRKAGF